MTFVAEIQIDRKEPETPLADVMGGAARMEVEIHEHGLVALCDVMPRRAPVLNPRVLAPLDDQPSVD